MASVISNPQCGGCRVADRLDFQGIRREVVAVLGCTPPHPDMLAPLLEMAEARQHDAELQQLKARFLPRSLLSLGDISGSEHRTKCLAAPPLLNLLQEVYMDALTLLLLRGDGDAARESWLGWMLRGFAAGIHCVLEVRGAPARPELGALTLPTQVAILMGGSAMTLQRCWKLLEEDTYVLKTSADLAALDSTDAALLAEQQPEALHAVLAAYYMHEQGRLADWEAHLRARWVACCWGQCES